MTQKRFYGIKGYNAIDLNNVVSFYVDDNKLVIITKSKTENKHIVPFRNPNEAEIKYTLFKEVINKYHSEPQSKFDWSVIVPLALGMLIGDLIYELIKHLL
jgi:hypothetical protein